MEYNAGYFESQTSLYYKWIIPSPGYMQYESGLSLQDNKIQKVGVWLWKNDLN